MTEHLIARLLARESAIRHALLSSADGGRDLEPGHRRAIEELVAALLHRFILLLDVDGPENGDGPEGLRGVGARYARAGVACGRALHDYHRTVIEVSRELWTAAEPSDAGIVLCTAQTFRSEVEPLRAALSEGHRAASGRVSREGLAESLLAGRPLDHQVASTIDLPVAERYLVLCIRAPSSSPADVATRLRDRGALALRQDDVMWILFPVSRRAVDTPAERAARCFGEVTASTAATVAGAGIADVAELPEAADEARTVLDIAEACGRRGAVRIEDVLVERALMVDSEAVIGLAAVVAPLRRWPHLVRTLEALYEHDMDRGSTADALDIARRTLTDRLDRVHRLTGIHPTSARGVQTFLSALAADRMCSAPSNSVAADLDAG